MDRSVFHVAQRLLSRCPGESLPAVSLQKLCFYSYSWYAHLTGAPLYPEQMWAMKYGPVVGDLLSAHSGQASVSLDSLEPQFEEWGLSPDRSVDDSYADAVIDAVFSAYSGFGGWELAEMSHLEPTWSNAWGEKGTAKRSFMPAETLLRHYSQSSPLLSGTTSAGTAFEIDIHLPDPLVTFVSGDRVDWLLEQPVRPHSPFMETLRRIGSA
ncbi:DUF4065 domain-containing protein [Corynebacterium sanguinis]|uniref:Panacea domain-containing protein n=1 Tax=Corynebacterium sanguinis TaxID=2594913 RepID=UPI00119F879A|nr:type II toxin-antitoxin system antitoxin SocA domain-containing protein [Corynebacterium sanguinis]MCT1443708.1 DUF4065 domain-containing protein [Corynebacterium sanguinis]TVS25515.1 DUF4065 domain-containing protein [Corynebacterium sanguinis]